MLRGESQRHNKLGKYIESISSTEAKKYEWFNAHIWGFKKQSACKEKTKEV